MKPLECTLCNPSTSEWDDFVAGSPQSTIFCRSSLLAALGEHELWALRDQAGRLRAGIPLLLEGGHPRRQQDEFCLYQGPLLDSSLLSMSLLGQAEWTRVCLTGLVCPLMGKYSRLLFGLHHSHEDLRPIQWINYHQPERGKFELSLSYTGLIHLDHLPTFDDYLAWLKPKARLRYRRSLQAGLVAEPSRDPDILCRLYAENLARQGCPPGPESLSRLRRLTEVSLQEGFGELLVVRKGDTDELAGASLYFFDDHTAYGITAASRDKFQADNVGTFGQFQHFQTAWRRKVRWIDQVGMNSPRRGDYKSECGARLKPYFTAQWADPTAITNSRTMNPT